LEGIPGATQQLRRALQGLLDAKREWSEAMPPPTREEIEAVEAKTRAFVVEVEGRQRDPTPVTARQPMPDQLAVAYAREAYAILAPSGSGHDRGYRRRGVHRSAPLVVG